MPFKAQEIRHKDGLYYGQNAISKNLILANRWELLNGNGFNLGVSGSGKSLSAKREMIQLALSTNDDILIIDPEPSAARWWKHWAVRAVRISAASNNHINAHGYGGGLWGRRESRGAEI